MNLKEFDTYPKQKVFKKSLAQFKFIDHDLLFPSKSQSFQTQPKFPQTKTFEMPSSDAEKPMVSDNRDGTISVKYDPKQEGNYELQIKHNNMPIKGSPYKFVVDNTPKGLVTAFGTYVGISSSQTSFSIFFVLFEADYHQVLLVSLAHLTFILKDLVLRTCKLLSKGLQKPK